LDFRWAWGPKPTSLAVFWGETLFTSALQPAKDADMTVWDYMAERATDEQRLKALAEASDRLVKDLGTWSVRGAKSTAFSVTTAHHSDIQ